MPNSISIIYQDQDLLVINKPAGLAVHRALTEKSESINVVSQLLKKYPDLKGVGEDPVRPGIVHRLDKETSGVMLVARNQKTFEALKNAFKKRQVKKTYLALVEGLPAWQHNEINLSLKRLGSGTFGARHPNDVATLPKDKQLEYRPACTNFTVLDRTKSYSLIKAEPQTGRTHQIRVHLKALGFPVVGDSLYAPKKALSDAKKTLGLTRQFLHAAKISVVHPTTKKMVTFEAALPKDLLQVLAKLKISYEKTSI